MRRKQPKTPDPALHRRWLTQRAAILCEQPRDAQASRGCSHGEYVSLRRETIPLGRDPAVPTVTAPIVVLTGPARQYTGQPGSLSSGWCFNRIAMSTSYAATKLPHVGLVSMKPGGAFVSHHEYVLDRRPA